MTVSSILAAFESQAERVGATVRRTTPSSMVDAALSIVREAGCRTVALARALPDRAHFVEAMDGAGLSEVPLATLWPVRRADAGISHASMGVAETGSLLLHSTSEDRRVELCVDVHLVLVDGAALVPSLDEAFAALKEIASRPPAYVSLVSGPSRSADIERQITIGVHGPRALHVLVVEAAS
jgi:L-lactate dehydrogenase complex protein LldG